MISNASLEENSDLNEIIIKIFSNLTRLKIISCLADGEKNVSELIRKCSLSQSAVSQHLMKLRSLGVVDYKKDGREVFYSLKIEEVGKISNQIFLLLKKSK